MQIQSKRLGALRHTLSALFGVVLTSSLLWREVDAVLTKLDPKCPGRGALLAEVPWRLLLGIVGGGTASAPSSTGFPCVDLLTCVLGFVRVQTEEEATTAGQPWPPPTTTLAVYIAVDDIDASNGADEIWPGSHCDVAAATAYAGASRGSLSRLRDRAFGAD